MLRCKKGDLAIVVKSFNGREGWIVEVVEYRGAGRTSAGMLPNLWRTKHPRDDHDNPCFSDDSHLLPIRPGDLQETEEPEKELACPAI